MYGFSKFIPGIAGLSAIIIFMRFLFLYICLLYDVRSLFPPFFNFLIPIPSGFYFILLFYLIFSFLIFE